MGQTALRILIIDENPVRTAILEDGLSEAGYRNSSIITDMRELLRQIVEFDPDVIFIDLENPNRDVLEQMFQVSKQGGSDAPRRDAIGGGGTTPAS